VTARLVDEDEPARIEALRKLDEREPEILNPGLGLLYRREGLFAKKNAVVGGGRPRPLRGARRNCCE
jgi:hypothetical protein